MMRGLLYKEWKQNKFFFIFIVFCGLVAYIFTFFLKYVGKLDGEDTVFRFIGIALATMLTLTYTEMEIFRGDDRKLWAYFITSTSEGYKGFLRIKYEMFFAILVIQCFSIEIFDELYICMAVDHGIEEAMSLGGVAMAIAFFQMLLFALEIPIFLLFGKKKTEQIGMIVSILFFFIIVLFFFLNVDYLVNITDGGFETFLEKLFTGKVQTLVMGIGNILILCTYYLSYRLSCRFYLKGVEHYDK